MELFPGIDPYVGAQIAGYKLEALVGRGGMSVVYRAQHQHLDRKVALKLLAPELSQDERFRNRFVRESRLAASLEHPNIIPIYDAGEAEGLLYIAMRFVEGCTLAEFMERHGRLLPPVAMYVLDHIADALDVAHSAGLVHRDVKPENIMVTEDHGELDRIFLSDFGLTKRPNMAGTTRSGELMGTVGYIAPEQIEGKSLDGRSDIYSLGCVLYQCLSGRRPFEMDNDVAILWAHLNQSVPRISDERPELPAAIDEVMATALAKDPHERYATAGQFATAARHALEAQARPPLPPASEPGSTWSPRLVSMLALTAIAIVTVILVVARQLATTPTAPGSAPGHSRGSGAEVASGTGLGQRLPTAPLNRSPTSTSYKNPLVVGNAPDPTVIAAGGVFYAYTTQTVYTRKIHLPVLASRDLVDWRFVGDALPVLPSWADPVDPDTWAPDIVKVKGHYNLYFAARLKTTGAMGIAVATSDDPKGPFRARGKPLMHASGYIDIDPFVFKDPNAQLLLYWGSDRAPIRVQRLSKDGRSLRGAPRSVLATSSATSYDRLLEGPAVVRHGGFYLLFYSGDRCCGSHAHYAVLVARSRSPLGPFKRAPTNPIVAANPYFGAPGHGTVFRDDSGAYFILYHAMERSDATNLRYLMLDRVRWQDGWPVVNGGNGPTHAPQPRPQVGA